MTANRLDTWIDMQRKCVEQDGSYAKTLRLEGPEGTWGIWPIETGNLAETIRQTIDLCSAELPKGHYQTKLLALDPGGAQVSWLPITITGKSGPATQAADTAKAHAQAVTTHLANAEGLMSGAVREAERLQRVNNELTDNQSILIETILKMQSENLDVELRREEAKARRDAIRELTETAKPLFEVLAGIVGERIIAADEAARTKKLKGGSNERPQPTNGRSTDGTHAAEGTPQDGPTGDPGNDRDRG